jgi:hypothetical protein
VTLTNRPTNFKGNVAKSDLRMALQR